MRHTRRWRAWAGRAALGLTVGAVGVGAALAQTPRVQTPGGPAQPAAGPAEARPDPASPVAYIYGNVPVTRQEYGEYLMARAGTDKLETFLNKMVIEAECRRLGVTVTETELVAALNLDMAGISVDKKQFIEQVLPKYGTTLYGFMEDVVRPRLLLTKLLAGQVEVTADEVNKQFEREYGEKRKVQIIMWPGGDELKAIMAVWAKIRDNAAEFDSAATAQANPSLGMAKGIIKPMGRHTHAKDPEVEKAAFQLKPGEVSPVIATSQGYVVMKLLAVVPPAKVDRAAVEPALRRQAFDEKLTEAIPEKFNELKKRADPSMLYKGPDKWRTPDAVVTTAPPAAPAAMPGGPVQQAGAAAPKK